MSTTTPSGEDQVANKKRKVEETVLDIRRDWPADKQARFVEKLVPLEETDLKRVAKVRGKVQDEFAGDEDSAIDFGQDFVAHYQTQQVVTVWEALAKHSVKTDGLVGLAGLEQIKGLPTSEHCEPGKGTVFVGREKEAAKLNELKLFKTGLTQMDKRDVPLLNYSTMSGAGKSRWGFEVQRILAKDRTRMVIRVGLNFNGGTGAGTADRDFVAKTIDRLSPMNIMAGLLLARGLLRVDPNALLNEQTFNWFQTLQPNEVINAIFDHHGNSAKTQILVVHVDELALVLPVLAGCTDPKRSLKDLVNPLSEYNTTAVGLKGKVLGLITHTCPTPWTPVLTEIGIKDLPLAPLDFGESAKIIASAVDEFDTSTLQNRRAVKACGGHPALLVVLRELLQRNMYHLGALFNASFTKAHRNAVNALPATVQFKDAARVILMQETVSSEDWLPMFEKGLLIRSPIGRSSPTEEDDLETRTWCTLACPYPMLVNILIRVNPELSTLVPPVHSKFSYDCFEVVIALKIAAEYGDVGAFRLRATWSLREELLALKSSATQSGVFLSKSEPEEQIEGAGLQKRTDGLLQLDVFQCKHAAASNSQQDIGEIEKFVRFVRTVVHGWAKTLGCTFIVATFATDRLKRDWTTHSSLLAAATTEGITLRFRLYTRDARVGTGDHIVSQALNTWLPDGVVCI